MLQDPPPSLERSTTNPVSLSEESTQARLTWAFPAVAVAALGALGGLLKSPELRLKLLALTRFWYTRTASMTLARIAPPAFFSRIVNR
jgi:hypothetical protein